MKPALAWGMTLGLLGATAALFWAPPAALVLVAAVAFAAAPQSRLGLLVFVAITVAIDALLLAWSSPGNGPTLEIGLITLGLDGAIQGAIGGVRLAAIVLLNLAFFGRIGVGAWLDALRLPRRTTVFLGALLIACRDLGDDAKRLLRAKKMTGAWPDKRLAQVVAMSGLVAPLMVAGVDRARRRRDALILAGMQPGRLFVPVVAITAIALAGRLALIALPNVSLTYVVVFAGGIAFGPLVGLAAGALSMGLSDVVLSGFTPTAYVNVPAMALVGLAGGLSSRFDLTGDGSRIALASWGVLATFAFSFFADATEWLIVPEFRGDTAFLAARVAAGLAFNVIPAVTNGLLFAAVVPAVQRAFKPRDQSTHQP